MSSEKEIVLKYKKLHPEAKLIKKHKTDSCFDVVAVSGYKDNNHTYVYHTGLSFDIPPGYEIKGYARSSISSKGLVICNSVAVIDEDYKGELILKFYAATGCELPYEIGDRIAQIQLTKKTPTTLLEVDDVGNSDRGSGGFGSTGQK